MKQNVSIIACARWEKPYIAEWLLYHRSIGFDHVYLYCNDDDPRSFYEEVLPFCEGANPFVTFYHFPFPGQQFQMYMHCLRRHKDESAWIAFLDIDEFLVLRGLNDINAYVASLPPDWDSVYFNWIFFGSNGFTERPANCSVLRHYFRRAERVHVTTKTLTRTSRIDLDRIDRNVQIWHHWADVAPENFGAYNVLGYPASDYFRDGRQADFLASPEVQRAILEKAVIYHYAFRSEKDFLIRFQRGVHGDFAGQKVWREMYDSGRYRDVLKELGAVTDYYLSRYWDAQIRRVQASCVVQRPRLPNLALGKPALQSSVSEWSRSCVPAEDAAGAVSGIVTGYYQFHTESEDRPWWRVDLGRLATIREVWVFNRIDAPAIRDRCKRLVVQVSDDDAIWTDVHTKDDDAPFGGADANPLVVVLPPAIRARFVRIVKTERNFLHLDQVEVYGDWAST